MPSCAYQKFHFWGQCMGSDLWLGACSPICPLRAVPVWKKIVNWDRYKLWRMLTYNETRLRHTNQPVPIVVLVSWRDMAWPVAVKLMLLCINEAIDNSLVVNDHKWLPLTNGDWQVHDDLLITSYRRDILLLPVHIAVERDKIVESRREVWIEHYVAGSIYCAVDRASFVNWRWQHIHVHT